MRLDMVIPQITYCLWIPLDILLLSEELLAIFCLSLKIFQYHLDIKAYPTYKQQQQKQN